MKKCIACGVLLCLVLTACAAGAETPTTTEPQLQISSTTTSTIPTVPSSTTPPTSCTPTTVPTTTKQTTVTTTAPKTSTPNKFTTCGLPMCYGKGHTYENGRCIYCNATEPVDVDARLIVNGKDITEGNYVKINHGYKNTSLPLTSILTELGIGWVWESDRTIRIDIEGEDMILDLDHPQFDWPLPPGTQGGVRKVVDGEVIVDGVSLYLLLKNQDIPMITDYDANIVRIAKPTYITEQIIPQGVGVQLIPTPGPYVIKEVGGQFYIDFGEGNQRIPMDRGDVRYAPYFYRDSMDAMYHTLMTGDFTMEELQRIRAFFILDEGIGFRLPNPKELYVLQAPEGINVRIRLLSSGVSYELSNGATSLADRITADYSIATKVSFESSVEAMSRIHLAQGATLTTMKHPERDATIYDIHMPNGFIQRYVHYSYQSKNKEFHVKESYPRYEERGDDKISEMSVHGMADGVYYSMRIGNYPGTPTVEWLLQFKTTPYTPQ